MLSLLDVGRLSDVTFGGPLNGLALLLFESWDTESILFKSLTRNVESRLDTVRGDSFAPCLFG